MQLQAISSYNKGFTGKRDRIDEAIVQDDKVIRDYAYYQSMKKVQDKKHKKLANALWYSIPVVAGISTALLTRGKSSMFGKEVSGLAAKVSNGIKAALPWAITLGIADTVIGAKNYVTNNSPTARQVENKHPFMSLLGTLGVGLAALIYAPRGFAKLYNKIGPKTMAKLGNGFQNAGNVINKIKAPKFAQNITSKLSEKAPSALKSATKSILYAAPEALLIGSLFHSINHSYNRNNEFNKNYSGMKEAQLNLAKARVRELKIENDFLKEFPENAENLALLKKPLKDIPEEATEKIDNRHNEIDENIEQTFEEE